MINLLSPQAVLGENIIIWVTKIGEFFMVLQPQALWSAPFLVYMFTKDIYMLYIFISFTWFDMTMAKAISNVYYNVTHGLQYYCIEAQMLGAFYGTVVSHFIFVKRISPGWITITSCTIGFIASIVILNTPSTLSIIFGITIGVSLGITRILLFLDLTTTHCVLK